MAFAGKFIFVISMAMLALVALIMAALEFWSVFALVTVLAGVFAALARMLSERRARTRRERLENEYLTSWPVHNVLLKDDRPGNRLGGVLTGSRDEDGHA